MKLKLYKKNILFAFIIVIGGFLLFNLAFVLAALVINVTARIFNMAHITQMKNPYGIGRIIYLIVIWLLSWLVLKSKLKDIIKATFLIMPLMVSLVMIGISLYEQSHWMIFGVSTLVISSVLIYLYMKKLPWLYFFSTFYVAILGLCIMIFNLQI